jgi:cytochrome P450
MQLLTSMELPFLPVDRPEFDQAPLRFVDDARRQHPWLARTNYGYFVYGYEAVKDFSAMDDKLDPSFDEVSEFYEARDTAWGRHMHENILAISGERHKRIRESIAHAFTPRTINQFRSLMRDRISELLDEWVPKGSFDFAEFASSFPISVLCGLLGTSTDAIPHLREALEAQGRVNSLRRELREELLAGHEVMRTYVNDLVVAREKSGPQGDGSLLDAMIEAKNAGKIDDVELRDLLIFLFPAGFDTSKNMMTLTMYMMLSRPEEWERCAADKEFCGKVLDEMFRYSSIATAFRTVAKEFVYGDVQFPVGIKLFIGNGMAGRDPSVFADADKFLPDRVQTSPNIAFGRGAHICIGQHLARAQIVEGLHVIAQRIKKPRLVGEITWRGYLGAWGPNTLPITFEPPR